MSISAGIMRLEARGGSDAPATIDAMIAEGGLQEADRSRCIHWSQMQAPEGCHERALGILS